jgi:hypothetical protein
VSESSRLRYPWGTRLRLLLLFLTASLQSFEWQAVAIDHLGREQAAVQLGLASGFGILVTVLSLSALTLRGTPLGITPLPSRLLLLNSLFSWVTSLYWDDWSWAPWLMLGICSLQSSLFLLSHSVEIASTQRQNPAEYPAVRAFGSVGHLIAALLSQTFTGQLFPGVTVLGILLWLTPGLVRDLAPSATAAHPGRVSLRGLLPLLLAGLLSTATARGFDTYGAILLRDGTQHGLWWLTVLILSEIVLLHTVSPRVRDLRWMLALGPIVWTLTYLLLQQQLTMPVIALSMALGGFNCPVQVALQTITGRTYSASASVLATVAVSGALGAFLANLTFKAGGSLGIGVLPLALGISAGAIPLVLLCLTGISTTPASPTPTTPAGNGSEPAPE